MDIWREVGITSNNSKEHYCFEKALLLVKTNTGTIEKEFPFETVSNETYQATSSLMPMEFTARAKTIFTPYYWLPFCKGARVRFSDGEELTVSAFVIVNDSKKAQMNGKGYKGIQLTF